MRIGISGAQSVGKTTLMNALRSEEMFRDKHICDEVTRRVRSYGLQINESGNDITQRLIMQEHIVNVFLYDNFITDRTALDGVVYSRYLFDHDKITDSTMKFAEDVFMRLIGKYDTLFYISPEFDITDDGIRSFNVEFRNDIVALFDRYIKDYQLPVTRLTGSVVNRMNQVFNTLKDRQ